MTTLFQSAGTGLSADNVYALAIRSVNDVPASLKVRVEKLEAALLVHRSEPTLLPLVTNAHCAELNG